MKSQPKIREAIVAGQFYPDRPEALQKEIADFLRLAGSKSDGSVRALIVPHAGYMYSGGVAAEAYKTVEGDLFDLVVVVAFLHRVFISGVFVDDVDFYETPLGKIPVDRKLAATIRESNPYLADTIEGDLNEHALEVQLPFLQVSLKEFRILPVYIGEQSIVNAEVLSNALARNLEGKKVLMVFSTDLSHFHHYEEAVKMDQKLIRIIGNHDLVKIERASHSGEIEACGLGPVITSLMLAEKMGWEGPRLLKYANSGDVTGEKSSVVGYAAMAYKTSAEQ